MDKILGGIYVGSVVPIMTHVPLKVQYNITHILSCMKFDKIPEYLVKKGYTLQNIDVNDDTLYFENIVDLLKYVNDANEFIDHAIFPNEENYNPFEVDFKKIKQKSAIFIHSYKGSARCCFFAICYLMYRFGFNLKQATYAVDRKMLTNKMELSDNLQEQLELFSKMGGRYVDLNNSDYKQWKLTKCMELDPSGQLSRKLMLEDKGIFENEDSSTNKKIAEQKDQDEEVTVLRCKKCRQNLAKSTSFVRHDPPAKTSKESHFFKRGGISGNRIVGVEKSQDMCTHFFVEPLNWMKEKLLAEDLLEGKFFCPGCEAKVGGYNWKGSRCSCGKWMNPGIHLQAAKVDQVAVVKKSLAVGVDRTD